MIKAIKRNHCDICSGRIRAIIAGLQDSRFGVPGEYSAVECRECGAISTKPTPTNKELSGLYKRYYNFGGSGGDGKLSVVSGPWSVGKGWSGKEGYERIREAIHKSFLYRIWLIVDGDVAFQGVRASGKWSVVSGQFKNQKSETNNKPLTTNNLSNGKRLLEIGCNEGRNLEIYRQNGWKAEGQEINPIAAKTARGRGFKVHLGSLERVKGRFDVVVLANVLEHSTNPAKMLGQVHKLLKKGGQVWISLPNNRSWLRHVFGRKWINWHVPFHVNHFGERSLTGLLSGKWFTTPGCRPAGISPAPITQGNGSVFARLRFATNEVGARSGFVVSGQSIGESNKYFNQKSKTNNKPLTTNNFNIISIHTITPALWVAQAIIAAIFACPGKPTRQLRNPVLVAGMMLVSRFVFFPFLIAGDLLGRGDALIVRARKA